MFFLHIDPNEDRVKGVMAESKMFYELKEYFESTGDDVLIVHSHKLLTKEGINEKDFILFNLTKGQYSVPFSLKLLIQLHR